MAAENDPKDLIKKYVETYTHSRSMVKRLSQGRSISSRIHLSPTLTVQLWTSIKCSNGTSLT